MAPKSPSMAFEPTPALEFNKENFSPLTENPNISTHEHRLGRRPSKEVHFSPVLSPTRRAQSLATSVPLLEPISSASRLPRQNIRIKDTAPNLDMNAYMDESRSLLEIQRLNFEREREVFEKERKLWNAERAMLKARIADLELNPNKKNTARRRFSNDAPSASVETFRKGSDQIPVFNSFRTSRGASEPNGAAPVWETPDMGSKVTRVFSNEEKQLQLKKPAPVSNSLPSIAENATQRPVSPHSVPVPVAMLDSSLDGITLKSAGLESSFVKANSPLSTSPPQPPSPGPHLVKEEKLPRVVMHGLLSPTDPILLKNAGHTPMEFGGPVISELTSGTESRKSPEGQVPAIKHESWPTSKPKAPAMPPSERSDSYFSSAIETETDDEASQEDGDLELKGPLIMDSSNENAQDNQFLHQLDAKLLAEALRPRQPSMAESDGKNGFVKIDDEVDDGGPRLKLKKSTNFGSAFGSKICGNV
jgi:hypothetical protein